MVDLYRAWNIFCSVEDRDAVESCFFTSDAGNSDRSDSFVIPALIPAGVKKKRIGGKII